jgi:hypothetical protein
MVVEPIGDIPGFCLRGFCPCVRIRARLIFLDLQDVAVVSFDNELRRLPLAVRRAGGDHFTFWPEFRSLSKQ